MLRPTFMAFETARNALTASQYGLDTVGHNISNVNTMGYTRQRVDQVSVNNNSSRAKFMIYGNYYSGQGSRVTGISQIRDPFLDKRFRNECATCGEYDVKADGLADLLDVFDEISTNGLHAKFEDFLYQLDELIKSPESEEVATVLRSTVSQVLQLLQQNQTQLESIRTQQHENFSYDVDQVNLWLDELANLNKRIQEQEMYGNPANELRDSRNMLLDDLSTMVGIDVSYSNIEVAGKTIEKMTVTLKGTDIVLLDGGSPPAKFSVSDPDPTTGLVTLKCNGQDVTYDIKGGFKGYIEMLNGYGPTSSDPDASNYRGIPYYMECLNSYATELVDALNSQNRIAYYDPVTGDLEYIDRDLITGSSIADFEISQEWKDNSLYITRNSQPLYFDFDGTDYLLCLPNSGTTTGLPPVQIPGATLGGLTANPPTLIFDVDGYLYDVASSSRVLNGTDEIHISELIRTDGTTPALSAGEGATSNLLLFKEMLTTGTQGFYGSFRGTFQNYLVGIQSDVGLDKQMNTALLDASYGVLVGLSDSRDAVSAVSVDEEAINMMTYQNYYNAAARYMTVIDEALGTIIQGMGVVGR